MSAVLEELKVILTIIWWLQKFRRDYHYLSKCAMQKFIMGRFNLKKLNNEEGNEQSKFKQTGLQF
jgi:hypothetical protein